MRIEASIDYWDESVLTFDPEKVLVRLRNYFPEVLIDPKDYSLDELERFTKYANEKIEEPCRSQMIASMQGKKRANGPIFKFKISLSNIEINGAATRYRVAFESKQKIDFETEIIVVNFLQSLKYGQIHSNTQTDLFCEPAKNFAGHWLLKS